MKEVFKVQLTYGQKNLIDIYQEIDPNYKVVGPGKIKGEIVISNGQKKDRKSRTISKNGDEVE